MNARRLAVTLILAVATALSTAEPVHAQQPHPEHALTVDRSGDWTALERMPGGALVRVELATGRSAQGRIASVDDDGLSISVEESRHTFQRLDIRKVLLVQRQTGTKAKRGLVIGAVAGGLVGGLTSRSNRLAWTAFLAAGWAAVGATIGAIDGFGDSSETLIYATSDDVSSKVLANLALQPTAAVLSQAAAAERSR